MWSTDAAKHRSSRTETGGVDRVRRVVWTSLQLRLRPSERVKVIDSSTGQ